MEKKLFDDLAQSMREAQAISKGATPASRRFEFPQVDAKAGCQSSRVILQGITSCPRHTEL
jgi:hypothetical protein